jgi:peptidoglycan/xylan/chitin deacetylase (PgdA/CDA1 family)
MLASRVRTTFARRTAIVYAHYYGGWTPHNAMFEIGGPPEQLDDQLTELARWFRFAPLGDVLDAHARATSSGPEPPVDSDRERPLLAITFDDGFDLIRSGVADVLERHGVRATTFLITSTIDNKNLMWRNKLSAIQSLRGPERCVRSYNALMSERGLTVATGVPGMLVHSLRWPMQQKEELVDELWRRCDMPALPEYLAEHRPYFTWSAIREWIDRGHDVGFHTHTHPVCSTLSDEGVRLEISEPARALARRLEVSSLRFSYPFGARLDASRESGLFSSGLFECLLGIGGFSPRGTAPHRLERAPLEGDFAFAVFGKPLLGRPRRSS